MGVGCCDVWFVLFGGPFYILVTVGVGFATVLLFVDICWVFGLPGVRRTLFFGRALNALQ